MKPRKKSFPIIAGVVLFAVALLAVMALPAGAGTVKAPLSAVGLTSGGTPIVLVVTSSPSAPPSGKPHSAAPSVTTPVPTDTPVPPPPPSPTATPAPSWHTVATYSGSDVETLPGFTTADPWQAQVVCTPPPAGQPATGYGAEVTVDGQGLQGGGQLCAAGDTTMDLASCTVGNQGAACLGTHTYVIDTIQLVNAQTGPYPMAPWTVTIEEWY